MTVRRKKVFDKRHHRKNKPGKEFRVRLRQRVETEARNGFFPVAVAMLRNLKDPEDDTKTVTQAKVISLLATEHNEMVGDILAEAALKLG